MLQAALIAAPHRSRRIELELTNPAAVAGHRAAPAGAPDPARLPGSPWTTLAWASLVADPAGAAPDPHPLDRGFLKNGTRRRPTAGDPLPNVELAQRLQLELVVEAARVTFSKLRCCCAGGAWTLQSLPVRPTMPADYWRSTQTSQTPRSSDLVRQDSGATASSTGRTEGCAQRSQRLSGRLSAIS